MNHQESGNDFQGANKSHQRFQKLRLKWRKWDFFQELSNTVSGIAKTSFWPSSIQIDLSDQKLHFWIDPKYSFVCRTHNVKYLWGQMDAFTHLDKTQFLVHKLHSVKVNKQLILVRTSNWLIFFSIFVTYVVLNTEVSLLKICN